MMMSSLTASAQSPEELQAIYNNARVQYVKPEALDQLMISIRPFYTAPSPLTDSLLLETLKTISATYSSNNHFKQGLAVYNQFLQIKEEQLSRDKQKAIANANQSVSERYNREESELVGLQDQVRQLEIDIDMLGGKRSGFKRYFSIGLIALSALIAAMLVSSGVKLNNLRIKLRNNREHMKKIHRRSILGNFSTGLIASIKTNLHSLSNSGTHLKTLLQKSELQSAEAIAALKSLEEALKEK